MANQTLKAALDSGSHVFGAWVSMNAERVVEVLDEAGYNFVGLDCQHGALTEGDAVTLLRRMTSARTPTIVRVSANAAALIGKVLDAGADGVIVPMVSTVEEARMAVAACRYPPDGVRSFGPIRPGLPKSTDELAGRVSCFVMIETREGVENADAICAVPGLAGIIVGPADLSIGLGLDPLKGLTTDQLFPTLSRIRAACEKHGVAFGIFAGSAASVGKWTAQGFRLLVISSDVGLIGTGAADALALARTSVDAAL